MSDGHSRPWAPKIVGFDSLFRGCQEEQKGISHGTKVLIEGPPGSGKTFFALALARDRLMHAGTPSGRLCYISPEIDARQLRRDFQQFDWFTERDQIFRWANNANTPEGIVIPILPDVESTYLPSSAGGMIEACLTEVATSLKERPSTRSSEPLVIIVDSLTAILKDSRDPGDRRRQAYRFIERLGKFVEPSPAVIFLLSEGDSATLSRTEAPPEELLADIVFKLSRKDTGNDRFLRKVKLTKSRGANMLLGDHSLNFVSSWGLDDVFASDCYASKVKESVGINATGSWGTIVISPRAEVNSIGVLNRAGGEQTATPMLSTGTVGLDAMIKARPEYWVSGKSVPEDVLYLGSTTLLLGASGTGKTTMALQFLLSAPDMTKCLYMSFENSRERVVQMFPADGTRLTQCNFLFRRLTNLDVNLWLAELSEIVSSKAVDRVVIDGLGTLLSTIDSKEYARNVEWLLGAIQKASRNTATIFATSELPVDFKVFAPPTDGLSITADNVIVLRNLPINDELRKTAYVLKARGHVHDRQVREVHIAKRAKGEDPKPLEVRPGLEMYSNLLQGEPKNVSVILQLFAENPAEQKFNGQIIRKLREKHRLRIDNFDFSRSEMTQTLENAASYTASIPSSDIRVVSLDEWWIREYGLPRGRSSNSSGVETKTVHPLLSLEMVLRKRSSDRSNDISYDLASNFWFVELQKACRVSHDQADSPQEELLAIPNYIDFGMLCVNRTVWEYCKLADVDWTVPGKVIDAMPRVWDCDPKQDQRTMFTLMKEAKLNYDHKKLTEPFIGFAFDMQTIEVAVCTFLEFCWSFGATEDFLVRDVQVYSQAIKARKSETFFDDRPAVNAMHFLQKLVLYGLMSPRTSLEDSKRSLFSRHFYSTLSERGEEAKLHALPFFPVGIDAGVKSIACIEAYHDAWVRIVRLLERVESAACWRGAKEVHEFARSEISNTETKLYDAQRRLEIVTGGGQIDEDAKHLKDDLTAGLIELTRIGGELRRRIAGSHEFCEGAITEKNCSTPRTYVPASKYMDCRDVLQLLDWHDVRVKMLDASFRRLSLGSVICDRCVETAPGTECMALTGYASTGAWMLGTLRPTHSPAISAQLIGEIVSLPNAVERSELGAGIPARKDFFDYYGHRKVKFVDHITWNDLLRFCGARSRRRDRTVCHNVRVSDLADRIFCELRYCLSSAQFSRQRVESIPDANKKQTMLEEDERTIRQAASSAIQRIYDYLLTEMHQHWRDTNAKGCTACAAKDKCQASFS